jgi:TonB family protein
VRFLLTLALFSLAASVKIQAQDPPPAPEAQETAKPPRIRVGGNVASTKLVNKVQPAYPPLARQTRISGTIRLHAILAKDGTVKQLEVVSGHPLLVQAALDAVHQWRYEPTLLNGDPVEVDTTVDVVFVLNQDSPASASPGAAIDPQLRGDIVQLFEAMRFKENATKGGRQIFESLRPALMASLPSTPSRERITDAYIDKLLALLQTDAYTNRVIAVYATYFSDDDIKGLVQFYQTPAGQHFNAVMPQLLGDLNHIGQQLALDNLPVIFSQLCKEFPELQDDPRFCKEPDPRHKSQLLPRAATRPAGL